MSLRRLAYATACGSEVGAATAHGRGESRDAGFGLAHQKNPEKQTQA